MNTLKIHIVYKFVEGPWGGGNQFLKALRDYFRKMGVYSESPKEAQVILFNSHHCLDEVFKAKRRYPSKIFIHRLGPIFHLARGDKALDKFVLQFNELFADGTIFQSNWSREKNYELGMRKCPYETIIMNAPDSSIFNNKGKGQFSEKKVRLIATSWSGNIRKGFDIYQFLDEHLDFNRYEMTFVGNSPIEFKNIRRIKPVPSQEVANILKEHDIYIIASSSDACSNALIEALHCGLPAVARNDSGHPEVIGQAGAFFEDERGVMQAIEEVARNYRRYRARIDLPTLDEVGQKYYQFAQTIYGDYLNSDYRPKEINLSGSVAFRTKILRREAISKLQGIKGIIRRSRSRDRGVPS